MKMMLHVATWIAGVTVEQEEERKVADAGCKRRVA